MNNRRASSRAEYERRMHNVVEHIDRHLDQPMSLQTLAGVAHFSPFHFHRIFAAWMGETLGDYLHRRRVELAAMRLVSQPRVPVLQIALSVGFGSGEAFARAFKGRFGCAPTSWRTQASGQRIANSKSGQVDRKIGQIRKSNTREHRASNKPSEAVMKVKLINRNPVNVAYHRHLGAYGKQLSLFWQTTVYPWMAANDLLAQPRYGISHDDPGITAPAQCRYDACVEISPGTVLTGNALTTTIPGGRYAVLPFKGAVEQIGPAWAGLLRDWLPASGLQLDARPCFEHYPRGSAYDAKTGVFDCEICIPVMPL